MEDPNIESTFPAKRKFDIILSNENKKGKKMHESYRSKVIHIRNIQNDVTEDEIIALGYPFGKVTNVLVLVGKEQAFIEMDDMFSASAMVTYFTNTKVKLREKTVYVQFSNRQELKTDSNANSRFKVALQAFTEQAVQNGEPYMDQNIKTTPSNFNTVKGGYGLNTVLHVIVENMVYPVTLDVIFQIFRRVGKVLKIITFNKANKFQCLIQYPDVTTAQAAKLSLDGQNIYDACCMLQIVYSKQSNLNIRYNNDKSWDYTNPNLPDGSELDLAVDYLPVTNHTGQGAPAAVEDYRVGQNGSYHRTATAEMLVSPFSAAVTLGLNPASNNGNAGIAEWSGLQGSGEDLSHVGQTGLHLGSNGSSDRGHPAHMTSAFQPSAMRRMPLGLSRIQNLNSPVLLVSKIDELFSNCDDLFVLFGVYGDVQRVKIMFNKKDTALVQMSEPQQALLAMKNLDKTMLWGQQIRVISSEHTTVQLPKDGQPDNGLTKDYGNSNLHRFKKAGPKDYSKIYPPSMILHLSNIPTTIEESVLREVFGNIGLHVQKFKFFQERGIKETPVPQSSKMAQVQLANLDEAIYALVKLHNYQLSETSHLIVSFSKITL